MKITDLHINGFGVWSGLSVGELSTALTLFFGENEAGKTTLMQFVRTALYGFSSERRQRYLPPVHGGQPGGSLYVSTPRGELEIQRHLDDLQDDSLGDIALTSTDGTVHTDVALESLLAGVDEPIFNNVFAVGLRELQELGTLDHTAAADHLYKLTSGLDRVSLVDVMRELRASRQRLWSDDEQPSQICDLLTRREKLHEQLASLAAQSDDWMEASALLAASDNEVAELQSGIARADERTHVIDVALQVYESWQARVLLDRRLELMGPLADLSEERVVRLARLNELISARLEQLKQIRRQRLKLRRQAAQMPFNRDLHRQTARIEALAEQREWLASLENQTTRLDAETTQLEADLEAECERLGLPADAVPADFSEVPRRTLAILRKPARRLGEAAQRLTEARSDRDAARQEADDLQRQLETELAERGHRELPPALDAAGTSVSQLRRRLQLEERIDKMTRDREELQEDIDDLLDRQVLPVWPLIAAGVPFVLGIVLILAGFFLPHVSAIGSAVALIGFGAVAVAVTVKIIMERSANRELDECNQQFDRLREQLRAAKEERDELDGQIPPGVGQLDTRLDAAETELRGLEELLPLDSRRQAAEQRFDAATLRETQAAEAVKEARKRWQAALSAVGLPSELTPKNVREMSSRFEHIAEIRRQIQSRREQYEQRTSEHAAVTGRINNLADELGIDRTDKDAQAVLRDLLAVAADHQQVIERRAGLIRQDRVLRRRKERCAGALDKHRARRASLLADAGVTDDDEFRRVAADAQQARQIRAEREKLNDQIAAVIDGRCDEAALAREIEAHSLPQLKANRQQLRVETEASRAELAELHARRGQLSEQLKVLAGDRRLDRTKLELGCIDQQLREAVRRWQVLAMTDRLLDSIRELYETERQPETLREASRYLEQLTEGQYTRVWTPMAENVLRVDNADGESLPLEVLSSGTREAVFLAVRLALVASYARRGAVLPLVLDDVLVNLDTARAKAAARVLRDFAKDGHQVLLFTCHEHIRKMFKSLRVEIRDLPDHAELVAVADESESMHEEHDESDSEFDDEADEAEAEEVHAEDDELADDEVADEDEEDMAPAEEEISVEDQFVDDQPDTKEVAVEAVVPAEPTASEWEFPEVLWEEEADAA